MLSKCNISSKLHLCTTQDRRPYVGHTWIYQLTQAIISCIPENNKLRELFIKWSRLNAEERTFVDENMRMKGRVDLYFSLKSALMHWETIQDTQGAPGFQVGLYEFTCDAHLDEELENVMRRIDMHIESLTKLKCLKPPILPEERLTQNFLKMKLRPQRIGLPECMIRWFTRT